MKSAGLVYKIWISAVLILGVFSCNTSSKKIAYKPNFILIMADDHGWGDTGYNGNDTIITPNLDKMAAEGIRFNRFYAGAPVCSPTRGSCITGRHPYRYGIYYANVGRMQKNEITLAEILKTQGYRTGHFGKWHLGTLTNSVIDANRGGRDTSHYAPPWDHGFDVCFSTESKVPTWDPMISPENTAGDIGSRTPGEHFGTYYWTGPGERAGDNLRGDDSKIITDRAIPFIKKAANDHIPFLSVIWFHTPHLPVVAGEDYRRLYRDYSEDIQHYYGCITAMDEQIGRLRRVLKELGIEENTVVFYCSDNGPEGAIRQGRTQGSTGGLRGRKRSLYEGGVRVPGLMLWPASFKEAMETDAVFSTSDYFPTVLDILDIDIRNEVLLDGISMIPLLKGEVKQRPAPLGFQSKNQLAWMERDFKIYSGDSGLSFALYNIAVDPGETHDISTEFPARKKKMMNELRLWKQSCKESDTGCQ